jgi:hypothetical protein
LTTARKTGLINGVDFSAFSAGGAMNRNRTWLLAGVCLLLSTEAAQAQVRQWQDVEGQMHRGAFVGVSPDGFVELRGSGQTRLHFHALSPNDQAYVREQLEEAGQTGNIPNVGETRDWTQDNGDTFRGRFLKADETHFYILVGADVQRIEQEGLSQADLDYAEATRIEWARSRDVPPGTESETESETPAGVVQGTPATAAPAESAPAEAEPVSPPSPAGRVGTVEVPKAESRETVRRAPPSRGGINRPWYVPPSNKAAAMTPGPVGGTTTFMPAGSSGGPYKLIAGLLTILALGAVATRLILQRAR